MHYNNYNNDACHCDYLQYPSPCQDSPLSTNSMYALSYPDQLPSSSEWQSGFFAAATPCSSYSSEIPCLGYSSNKPDECLDYERGDYHTTHHPPICDCNSHHHLMSPEQSLSGAVSEAHQNAFRTAFYNPFEIKHRRRTSRAQFKVLEKTFADTPKPNASVRRWLAQNLSMTPRGVQVWFQNRRAKAKLQKQQQQKEEPLQEKEEEEDEEEYAYSPENIHYPPMMNTMTEGHASGHPFTYAMPLEREKSDASLLTLSVSSSAKDTSAYSVTSPVSYDENYQASLTPAMVHTPEQEAYPLSFSHSRLQHYLTDCATAMIQDKDAMHYKNDSPFKEPLLMTPLTPYQSSCYADPLITAHLYSTAQGMPVTVDQAFLASAPDDPKDIHMINSMGLDSSPHQDKELFENQMSTDSFAYLSHLMVHDKTANDDSKADVYYNTAESNWVQALPEKSSPPHLSHPDTVWDNPPNNAMPFLDTSFQPQCSHTSSPLERRHLPSPQTKRMHEEETLRRLSEPIFDWSHPLFSYHLVSEAL